MNPWPIIGGVANVVCQENEFIRPNFGHEGDVLILTKPLGTQPAVNLKQKLSAEGPEWFKDKGITPEQIDNAYYLAMESMAHLNRSAAELMLKYRSHGATDITGFGLLGHASNLAAAQVNDVDLVIENIPVIDQMTRMVEGMPNFKVLKGFSAETSGGILTMINHTKARDFINEASDRYGQEVWIVGKVVKGTKTARITEDASVTQVSCSFLK